jgi:chromosomal replication initiation ATPase DnaA
MEKVTGVHRDFYRTKRSRRTIEITLRYIFVYLLRKHIPTWTLAHIAWKTKMGDHSSVINGLKRVEEWKEIPTAYKSENDIINKTEQLYGQRIENLV